MSPGPLHRLVDAAAHAVPGWLGRVVPTAERPAWHDVEHGSLQALQRGLAERHPEAGRAYAAVRGWALLVWQPLYLAVIGCHLEGLAWRGDRLSQAVSAVGVGDFELAAHEPRCLGDPEAAVRQQAASLRRACASLHARWQQACGLHSRAARRIEADCVLAALLAVSRRHGWPPAELRTWGERWLSALRLAGESGYVAYRDADGRERLALERRICCLDFRRAGGSLCASCPRLTASERLQRLAAG